MKDSTEVFLVHHIRELGDDAEEVKFVGVFSDIEKAQAAIDKIKSEPGFRDFPNGFSLEAHTLNRVGWSEGFDYSDDPKQRENRREA